MERRGTLVTALALILIGGYFLLVNLNVIPSLRHHADVARHRGAGGRHVLAGLHLRKRTRSRAWPSSAPSSRSSDCSSFSSRSTSIILGFGTVEWGDMGMLWPAFPLIVGIAFVVMWIADRFRDAGVLIPAAILLLVGFGGFAYTLGKACRSSRTCCNGGRCCSSCLASSF